MKKKLLKGVGAEHQMLKRHECFCECKPSQLHSCLFSARHTAVLHLSKDKKTSFGGRKKPAAEKLSRFLWFRVHGEWVMVHG